MAGRPSIFPGKKHRVQGLLTDEGRKAFESHRAKLAKKTGFEVELVSDGDTIEALARGSKAVPTKRTGGR